MAATFSSMLALGTRAPDFSLIDSRTHTFVTLQTDQPSIGTVIMFLCNHCPYVKHLQKPLVDMANHYQAQGIRFIAISSNDSETYPQDGPDKMRIEAETHHYPFPYLFDETQEIAKAYHAECTPDFFVFDRDLHCVYRGRFDASTPGNQLPVTGDDLSHALDSLIAGRGVSTDQKPSIGCNIKWKKQ